MVLSHNQDCTSHLGLRLHVLCQKVDGKIIIQYSFGQYSRVIEKICKPRRMADSLFAALNSNGRRARHESKNGEHVIWTDFASDEEMVGHLIKFRIVCKSNTGQIYPIPAPTQTKGEIHAARH